MGGVGADINAVEIVEKRPDGSVVDDFIVDLPPSQLAETIVTACQKLTGVRVEWIARYPEGGGLQSDLEALERMTADPPHAAETLVNVPGRISFSLGELARCLRWCGQAKLLDHSGARFDSGGCVEIHALRHHSSH
jgi:hypothetical protein